MERYGHYAQHTPTVVLFQRADSSASSQETDSNGCVVCDTANIECPSCNADEECQLRQQTCSNCAEYYCSRNDSSSDSSSSSSSSSSTPIGGIVGGVVGGVVVLLLVGGFLFYKYVYRKRHPRLEDDDMNGSIIFDDLEADSKISGSNRSSVSSQPNAPVAEAAGAKAGYQEKPTRRANPNQNKRLSSYESFMRPKTRNTRGKGRRVNNSVGPRKGQRGRAPYLDPNSNIRNSVATSISTTNASNILPIAYIPGVTVRPTKNNTRSIYSYETESLFSDWNTIENASIVGENARAGGNGPDKQYTTTAIKAQPKLVNVDKIEEENEDISEEEEENEDEYGNEGSDYDSFTASQSDSAESSKMKSSNDSSQFNSSTLINIAENTIEEESDSDVDSDIGEIARVASVSKKHRKATNSGHSDILIDSPVDESESKEPNILDDFVDSYQHHDDLQSPQKPHQPGASPNASSAGSFLFDVEIDDNHPGSRNHSVASADRSPFDDPHT